MLTGDRLFAEGEMRYEPYADAVMAACSMVPPRLVFMSDTPGARDLAPRLASRLGAAFLPCGSAFADEGALRLCDHQGRTLKLAIDQVVTDGQPPMTVPVVVTLRAGFYRMSWGLHDAELLIVSPDEDSAQTIPNLAHVELRRGFAQESIEHFAPEQRLADVQAAGRAGAGARRAALWQLSHEDGDVAVPHCWQVHIGPQAHASANYQLIVSRADVAAQVAALQERLASSEPIAPLLSPGPVPPPTLSAQPDIAMSGTDEESDSAGDQWDFSDDTLSGDEASTARIRAVLAEAHQSGDSLPSLSSMPRTPSARRDTGGGFGSPHSGLPGRVGLDGKSGPPASPMPRAASVGPAAMWEGVSSLPGAGDDDEDDSAFDFVSADTAPVPIVAPAGQKKEGR